VKFKMLQVRHLKLFFDILRYPEHTRSFLGRIESNEVLVIFILVKIFLDRIVLYVLDIIEHIVGRWAI